MYKVKKGDKVECLSREHGNETVGKIYTVSMDSEVDGVWFIIEADDNGRQNSYRKICFKLISRLVNTGISNAQVNPLKIDSGFSISKQHQYQEHGASSEISTIKPSIPKCCCGAHTIKSNNHSSWCEIK